MNDFDSRVSQILANLDACECTADAEKHLLREWIEAAAASSDPASPTDIRLVLIYDAVKKGAKERGWFFKGERVALDGAGFVVHAKSYLRFQGRLRAEMLKEPDTDLDSAESWTSDICDDLVSGPPWTVVSAPLFRSLPLHEHGTPFWVADPSSGRPPLYDDIAYYPARAGLPPQADAHVLLGFPVGIPHVPRFADSMGFPYWRPGGHTCPIDGCPSHFSGFLEGVVDQVRLQDICKPIEVFDRSL